MSLIACSATSSPKNTAGGLSAPDSPSPTPIEITPSPDAPSPTSEPTATATVKPTPKPPRTVDPLKCATTSGKHQSLTAVRKQLEAAAHINEYVASGKDPSTLDPALNGVLPKVTVPLSMLKAVAAEESGWTSTCISSDGNNGYGVMQMQPDATGTVNDKFSVSFVNTDQSTNVLLGNAYLEWLTVHFGILYYHNDFNLNHKKLRDTVLEAYNAGPSAVDPTAGHTGLTPPFAAAQYADAVDYFMTYKPVQSLWGHCPKYC